MLPDQYINDKIHEFFVDHKVSPPSPQTSSLATLTLTSISMLKSQIPLLTLSYLIFFSFTADISYFSKKTELVLSLF